MIEVHLDSPVRPTDGGHDPGCEVAQDAGVKKVFQV
jgi:hypothetical protein